jgi:hypothetical protein
MAASLQVSWPRLIRQIVIPAMLPALATAMRMAFGPRSWNCSSPKYVPSVEAGFKSAGTSAAADLCVNQRRHPAIVIVSPTEHPTPAAQFRGERCAEKAEAIRIDVVAVVPEA